MCMCMCMCMCINPTQGYCKHKELFSGTFERGWLAPSFAAAFEQATTATAAGGAAGGAAGAAGPSADTLRSLIEEVSPGIYAFDLLSTSFCDRLLDELDHYEASGLPIARPNSMNNCKRTKHTARPSEAS